MQATPQQIIALTKLQHVDLETARLKRELDALPQKKAIVDARAKKAQIAEKHALAARLKGEAEGKLERLEEEDREAARKLDAAASDAAAADFRCAQAAGEDMAAAASHRDDISDRAAALFAQIDEADALIAKMDAALAALDARESELVNSYREAGGKLLERIAAREKERPALAEAAGPSIMGHYERIAAAKGGMAMAYLDGSSCNTCRSSFDEGRVLKLRSEAPLTICPGCGRLMVVDKRYNG